MRRRAITELRCAILLPIALAACQADDTTLADSTLPVVRDSAGVQYVQVSAIERAFPDSVAEQLRISPADTGMNAFGGLYPGGVATNGIDRIYVLDADDAQIVMFDDTGRALQRLGRRGRGPGEFEYGSGLTVDDAGNVAVFDFMRGGFLRFAPDGSLLPPIILPRDSAGSPLAVARVSGSSMVYGRRLQRGDSLTKQYLLASSSDTSVLASITLGVSQDIAFTSCPIRLRGIERYFAPTFALDASSDEWMVQPDASWRLNFYRAGQLTRVLQREVPVRATSVELLKREIPEGFRIRAADVDCTVPHEEIAERIGMEATVPALRRVAVAPDGTIFAERFEPREDETRVDVVARDGRLLGTIAGRGAPLGFLSGGRVLYAEEDEDTGLMELVVLRVSGAGW